MAHVRYNATRSLVTGHAQGSQQFIDLTLESLTRQRRSQKAEQVALSGKTYTTYRYGSVLWACTTAPRTWAQTLQMREFLDSVEDGVEFVFSPTSQYGDSPADLHQVVMDSDGYEERRSVRRGDGGGDDYFDFRFTLREVPPYSNSLQPG